MDVPMDSIAGTRCFRIAPSGQDLRAQGFAHLGELARFAFAITRKRAERNIDSTCFAHFAVGAEARVHGGDAIAPGNKQNGGELIWRDKKSEAPIQLVRFRVRALELFTLDYEPGCGLRQLELNVQALFLLVAKKVRNEVADVRFISGSCHEEVMRLESG